MARIKGLGELEQQVMDFLWKRGPATGEAIRAAVSKDRALTDSTIRTVLRRLEAKQYVRHEMEGRQFVYSSAREPRKVATEAVRNVLKNFCRGSLEELLTGLVDHRVVGSAELRRLAEKIDLQEKKEEGGMTWESQAIALLSASLVRPFALAAAAWVILRALRIRHPASRHAVWTAVLIGMAILPFVNVIAPHWSLPVLPAKHAAAQTPAPAADSGPAFEPAEPVGSLSARDAAPPAPSPMFKWPTLT